MMAFFYFSCDVFASNALQAKPLVINQTLVNKIHKLKSNSSNASDIEKMIGSPIACLPVHASYEAWVCQWKGNLASAGIANTLNIWFEAGMTTSIIAIDAAGNFLKSP